MDHDKFLAGLSDCFESSDTWEGRYALHAFPQHANAMSLHNADTLRQELDQQFTPT